MDLQKLMLKKQESLAKLALQCPGLQDVDLTDCESLTNSVCEVFSDGGGCPMLKSLVLDNCEVSFSLLACHPLVSPVSIVVSAFCDFIVCQLFGFDFASISNVVIFLLFRV